MRVFCAQCAWWLMTTPANTTYSDGTGREFAYGQCKLNPEPVQKRSNDWCGQGKSCDEH